MACGCERTGSSVVVVGLQKSARSSVLEESGVTADWAKEVHRSIRRETSTAKSYQPPQNLVEGACKGERKRKKEACRAHLPSGRRQLTESADSGRRSRSRLALHSH